MAIELEGEKTGRGVRIALAVSRFNENLTLRLLEGALMACQQFDVQNDDLTVVWVPGSFELPTIAAELAKAGRHDVIVCLGVVIKGETAHFEHVSEQAAAGIAAVSRESGVPVMFGVLTAYTEQQALDRSGGMLGNRGFDVTVAGLEMANVVRKVRGAVNEPSAG
ncbi:MAG: 6,7-dimethyl-8-ribityllumazine synthase [Chloroflexota bacterium]|nr:6,7-dimethyl-8-ribityllumazine synthase [Chloroflexota bacterium]